MLHCPPLAQDRAIGGRKPAMTHRFDEKVVIVTGGASGIGEATARAFAAEGAHVIVADVDRERGAVVAGEVGGRFEPTDVGDEAEIARLIQSTAQSLERIDVLVSNAFATAVGPIETLTLEGWRSTQ